MILTDKFFLCVGVLIRLEIMQQGHLQSLSKHKVFYFQNSYNCIRFYLYFLFLLKRVEIEN